MNSPITKNVVISEFAAYGVANNKKDRAILLLTDRQGVVMAMRLQVHSARLEKGVY